MNMGTSLSSAAVQRPQRPEQRPEQRPDQRADKSPGDVFKSLDVQNKGYITQTEFARSTRTISAEGAKLANQDNASAAEFSRLDSNQDGKLTGAEFKAGAPSGPALAQGPTGGPSGAPRGPRPPAPPGDAAEAASGSIKRLSDDPADTNQDGTVSATERTAAQRKSASQDTGGDGFAARAAASQYERTAAMTAG